MSFGRVVSRILPVTLLALLLVNCSDSPSDSVVLTAEMPLHLEEHLDAATIVGSEVPAEAPAAVVWRFDEPQPEWKPVVPWNPTMEPATLTRTEDALRVTLSEGTRNLNGTPRGGIELAVPGWSREDWAYLVVRARTSEEMGGFRIAFNRREGSGTAKDEWPYRHRGDWAPVVSDGAVQTYLVRADWSREIWEGEWRQLALRFYADEPASIDILSISLIPKEANYGDAAVGVREEVRNRVYRRAIYTHAPGRLEYRVRVPEAGWRDLDGDGVREQGGREFRFTVTTSPIEQMDKAAVYLQQQLRRVGAQREVQLVAGRLGWDRMKSGDFQAALTRQNVGSARARRELFGEDSWLGYRNPRVPELLDTLEVSIDRVERDRIYGRLSSIFQKDLPVTFLYPLVATFVAHRSLRGLTSPFRADPVMHMEELWLEDEK